MILIINKYHRVEGGETASSITISKPTEEETIRAAQSKAYELAHNYSDDKSVIDWSVSIYDPRAMTCELPLHYFTPETPDVPPEETEMTDGQ